MLLDVGGGGEGAMFLLNKTKFYSVPQITFKKENIREDCFD